MLKKKLLLFAGDGCERQHAGTEFQFLYYSSLEVAFRRTEPRDDLQLFLGVITWELIN